MTTRRQLVAAGATAAAFLGMATAAAFAQDYTFRFASLTPETGYVHAQHLTPFKEAVETNSDGRIEIDLQPAGVYGKGPQLHELTEKGVIDMSWTVQGYTSGRFPQSSVVELPFLYDSGEAGSELVMSMFEEGHFDEDYASVKVLGLYTHRPYALFTNGAEVRSVADLQGLKVRTPSALIGDTLNAIGATPVGLPVGEIAENLRRGVIDGSVFPYEAIKLFGLDDQVKSLTDLKLAAPRFMVIMNKDAYENLPEDLQQIIDDASGKDFAVAIGAGLDEEERKVKQSYDDGPLPVIEMDEAMRAELEKLVQPTVDSWLETTSDAGVDAQMLLDRARGTGGS